MSSNLWTELYDKGAMPPDAIVMRGYLGRPTLPAFLLHLLEKKLLLQSDGATPLVDDASLKVLPGQLKGQSEAQRIYLNARFDTYVDFLADDLLCSVQHKKDDTYTVWLRAKKDDCPRTYTVVSERPFDSPSGFVRGELLDDFMAQPEAEIVWDEQNYGPNAGKPSGTRCY